MKLDKSYKVKVNPEQSREIQELVFKNGGKWESGSRMVKSLDRNFLYILEKLELTCGTLDVAFVDCEYTEITAPELITLLKKETKMPNLSDFLKCEKVRCIESNKSHGLKKGEIYDVISTEYTKLGFGEWLHIRISKNGEKNSYLSGFFEPVLETAIQATDSLDDTPMGTRTVSEFEVGDRVYWATNSEIYTINSINNHVVELIWKDDCETAYLKEICHATQENYERLSATFDIIDFEQPPKELTGSDLCRVMLDKGWKYVPCYASNKNDKDALQKRAIIIFDEYNNADVCFYEVITESGWNFAVPFDPKTGQVLTSEVLDD